MSGLGILEQYSRVKPRASIGKGSLGILEEYDTVKEVPNTTSTWLHPEPSPFSAMFPQEKSGPSLPSSMAQRVPQDTGADLMQRIKTAPPPPITGTRMGETIGMQQPPVEDVHTIAWNIAKQAWQEGLSHDQAQTILDDITQKMPTGMPDNVVVGRRALADAEAFYHGNQAFRAQPVYKWPGMALHKTSGWMSNITGSAVETLAKAIPENIKIGFTEVGMGKPPEFFEQQAKEAGEFAPWFMPIVNIVKMADFVASQISRELPPGPVGYKGPPGEATPLGISQTINSLATFAKDPIQSLRDDPVGTIFTVLIIKGMADQGLALPTKFRDIRMTHAYTAAGRAISAGDIEGGISNIQKGDVLEEVAGEGHVDRVRLDSIHRVAVAQHHAHPRRHYPTHRRSPCRPGIPFQRLPP